MEHYEANLAMIASRSREGLALLREHYTVHELSVGEFQDFTVSGRKHHVNQYEIEGVGNLIIMSCSERGTMQMDTFTLTPYYKNLPLFTSDYMYFEEKRMLLIEVYNLVGYQDRLYLDGIEEFRSACSGELSAMPDMPMKACWYDDLRPVCFAKETLPEQDGKALELFLLNLSTFIGLEEHSPLLSEDGRRTKWDRNFEYARGLVEDGGVSTSIFVKSCGEEWTKNFFYKVFFAPYRYRPGTDDRLISFYDLLGEDGLTNRERAETKQKVICRKTSTDLSVSTDPVNEIGFQDGIVRKDNEVVGFGIEVLNEEIYPMKYFTCYLRDCGLQGSLDLEGLKQLRFVELYSNEISSVRTGKLPELRILGLQRNRLRTLDLTGMPALQGVDAGMNDLEKIDVSGNPVLCELYLNDNVLNELEVSSNNELRYLYVQNNQLKFLDVTACPALRHLDATGNPLRRIAALAPQNTAGRPLTLEAGEGGTVGLCFRPVYNAQWKETGEWIQCYEAYPEPFWRFSHWEGPEMERLSEETIWKDVYGSSRVLKAVFVQKESEE